MPALTFWSEPEGQSQHIFCVLVKYQHFYKFLQNVGISPEHKKYAGSDLLVRARRSELAYFLCPGQIPTFLQNVGILPEFFKVAKKMPKGCPWTLTNILM